jgi:hypothetical protein
MVYLKVNVWNLKMYTATVFEKEQDPTHTWKIFQGEVNIWNEMWTCEWEVSESIGKGVNKTEWKVTDKMVKCSDMSENVLRQLQIVQTQHMYVISSQKIKKTQLFGPTLLSNFLLKKPDFLGIFKNVLIGFYCMCLIWVKSVFTSCLHSLLENLTPFMKCPFSMLVAHTLHSAMWSFFLFRLTAVTW